MHLAGIEVFGHVLDGRMVPGIPVVPGLDSGRVGAAGNLVLEPVLAGINFVPRRVPLLLRPLVALFLSTRISTVLPAHDAVKYGARPVLDGVDGPADEIPDPYQPTPTSEAS